MPKNSLKIDYDGILQEWLDLSEQITEAGRMCADKHFEMNVAKADMEVKEAELVKRVTSNPEKYGLEKTNAKDVSAAVATHKAYLAKQMAFFEAKKQLHFAEARYEGFVTKRKSMEQVMFFVTRDWYSTHKNPKFMDPSDKQKLNEIAAQRFYSKLAPKKKKKGKQ